MASEDAVELIKWMKAGFVISCKCIVNLKEKGFSKL
jgi:hypothetical protein